MLYTERYESYFPWIVDHVDAYRDLLLEVVIDDNVEELRFLLACYIWEESSILEAIQSCVHVVEHAAMIWAFLRVKHDGICLSDNQYADYDRNPAFPWRKTLHLKNLGQKAIQFNSTKCFEVLMPLLNLSQKSSRGVPLEFTKPEGGADCLAMLVCHPEWLPNARTPERQNALMIYAQHGMSNVVRSLVDLGKLDINEVDASGDTALHVAAKEFRNMAGTYNVKLARRQTVDADFTSMMSEILLCIQLMATVKQTNLSLRDFDGQTALDILRSVSRIAFRDTTIQCRIRTILGETTTTHCHSGYH